MPKEYVKAQETAVVETTPTVVASSFPLSLAEFCTRLSETDRRVELINAFHHTEKASGRLTDTEQSYKARFEALAKRPA